MNEEQIQAIPTTCHGTENALLYVETETSVRAFLNQKSLDDVKKVIKEAIREMKKDGEI